MELILDRVGRLRNIKKEHDIYCVGYADYVFISEKGIECKIIKTQNGQYALVLLCQERNTDFGREPELKYDIFSSQEELKEKLKCYGCYIDWQQEDCFSVNVFRYNVYGKIMNGQYQGCSCMIEDNNGEYTLFVYNNNTNECKEILFFNGVEEMEKKCPFIIDFSHVINVFD